MAIDERLLRDLELPEAPGQRLFVTASGDVRALEGKANVRSAVRRRVVTLQGAMVHRPSYGGNLPLYIEDANSQTVRSQMSVDLRRNVLRDSRLEDASAEVSLGDPSNPINSFAVTVDLSIRVRDDEQAEGITLELEE